MRRISALFCCVLFCSLEAHARFKERFNTFTQTTEYEASIDRFPEVKKQQGFMLCWAASIQMIFAHYGFEMEQKAIVQKIKNVVVDQPGWPIQMTQALCSEWEDSRGRRFLAQCKIYDVMSGTAQFDNDTIIEELKADRPLVYCTTQHAMVLVNVKWIERFGAQQIFSGTVLDPSPFSPDIRDLNMYFEGRPTFAATVAVKALGTGEEKENGTRPHSEDQGSVSLTSKPFLYLVQNLRDGVDPFKDGEKLGTEWACKLKFPGASKTKIMRADDDEYVRASFRRTSSEEAKEVFDELARMAKDQLGPSWKSRVEKDATSDEEADWSAAISKSTERVRVRISYRQADEDRQEVNVDFVPQ